MICLLCGQEFSEKETFLGIITMRKSRYLICKECQENFEKLVMTTVQRATEKAVKSSAMIARSGQKKIIKFLTKHCILIMKP